MTSPDEQKALGALTFTLHSYEVECSGFRAVVRRINGISGVTFRVEVSADAAQAALIDFAAFGTAGEAFEFAARAVLREGHVKERLEEAEKRIRDKVQMEVERYDVSSWWPWR